MGCRFSCAAASSAAYSKGSVSPAKSVSLRPSIRRRESFRHASTILIDRVARRMHEEWRGARRLGTRLDAMANGGRGDGHREPDGLGVGPTAAGKEESTSARRRPRASYPSSADSIPEEFEHHTQARSSAYEPFYESIGGTHVDVANMDWDELPETLKNARTRRSKIVVEAVVAELRKLNAKAEALMREEGQKVNDRKQRIKELGRKGSQGNGESKKNRQDTRSDDGGNQEDDQDDARFKLIRRKSISLSMDMVDSIAELEYVSNEPPAGRNDGKNLSNLSSDADQNQNQNEGGEDVVPWEALTEEERASRYQTTLCAISEWNTMMAEAERPVEDYFPLGGSASTATATALSPYAMPMHTPSGTNNLVNSAGGTTPMSGMSGSAYSVGSAGSGGRHRLDISTMSASSSPLTSEPSPLAASPAFARNMPLRLTSGSHRGGSRVQYGGGSSAVLRSGSNGSSGGRGGRAGSSSRNLKRVLSGRDVLQEIRQTIRVTASGRLEGVGTVGTGGRGGGGGGGGVGVGGSGSAGMSGESAISRTRSRMRWAALRVVETTRAHLRKQIRRNKNFVRVFVSSTFRDFHGERDYLFQRVFPRLESACAERGILFIPVDLRWGVTEKEALDGEVIKLCLQEVDTCRPFFVAMLGERYGWHIAPNEKTTESAEGEDSDNLLRKSFDVAGMTFPWVHKWRDRSATEIEIRHAVLNNPRAKMRSFFYFRDPASAEICGGAASGKGDQNVSSPKSGGGAGAADSIFAPESAHAKTLQDALKDSIRAVQSSDHKVLDGYRSLEELGKAMYAQLKEAIDRYVNQQSLASVATALKDGTAVQKPTPLSSSDETELQVVNRNDAVAKALRHAYAKNQNLFSRVEDYCGVDSDNTPLVIVGGPGSGKSALVANLSESRAPQLSNTVAVVVYIGSQSQNPTVSEVVLDLMHLLRHALQRLEQQLAAKVGPRPAKSMTVAVQGGSATSPKTARTLGGLRRQASTGALLAGAGVGAGGSAKTAWMDLSEGDAMENPIDLFNKILEEAGHEAKKYGRRLLVGLDGVDRVHDNSVSPLAWIPVATPSNVQMLITLSTGENGALESSHTVGAIGEEGAGVGGVKEEREGAAEAGAKEVFDGGGGGGGGDRGVLTGSIEDVFSSSASSEAAARTTSDPAASASLPPTKSQPRQTQMSPHVMLGRRITRMLKVVRDRKWHVVEVAPMSRDEQRHLVSTFLNLYGKKFSREQMSLVLGGSTTENELGSGGGSGRRKASSASSDSATSSRVSRPNDDATVRTTANPLYMITVLNEIRKFGSFENLGARLQRYLSARNTTELFAQVLARLDEEIGRGGAVQCAARVIWVAQSGVSEQDLRRILTQSSELSTADDFDEFRHRTRDVFVNRANLVSFVHGSLADAVEDSCFGHGPREGGHAQIEAARNLLVGALERHLEGKGEGGERSTGQSEDRDGKDGAKAGEAAPSASKRGDGWWYQMRELSYQYSMMEDWARLSRMVGRVKNFVVFSEFDPELLIRYWRLLRLQHIRPDVVYAASLKEYSRRAALEHHAALLPAVVSVEEAGGEEKDGHADGAAKAAPAGGERGEAGQSRQTESSYASVVEKSGRRASTVPGRRRSLRGIDLERLLLKPLSGAGKLLVAGSGGGGDSASSSSSSPGEKEQAPVSFPPKRLTLELELELIDAEREILLRLVRFFQMMGEYRVALDYARKALLMMESMPRAFFGVVEVSSMLIEMALLEHKLHDFTHAMPHLVRANDLIVEFLQQHPHDLEVRRMRIVVLGDMANLLRETGRFDDALMKYDEALIWTTRYLGPDDVECAVHLNNLANLLMEEQRSEEALEKYERSLEITRAHYGEEHPEVARTLHNIGLCLKRLGDYGDAMDHFMAAVKMMVDALGTYHPEVGIVLNNVSILYSLRARQIGHANGSGVGGNEQEEQETRARKRRALYLKAQQAAERSVVIRERTLGSNHPTLAGAYTNLGKIYMLTGNEQLSEQCYGRAVKIASEGRLGENHPLVGRGLAQLGKIATRRGELENAKEKFQRALRVLRTIQMFGMGGTEGRGRAGDLGTGGKGDGMQANKFAARVERSLVKVEKKIRQNSRAKEEEEEEQKAAAAAAADAGRGVVDEEQRGSLQTLS